MDFTPYEHCEDLSTALRVVNHTVLRGHLSLLDAAVGTGGHLCAFGCMETTSLRQKETALCQSVTLSTHVLWHIG